MWNKDVKILAIIWASLTVLICCLVAVVFSGEMPPSSGSTRSFLIHGLFVVDFVLGFLSCVVTTCVALRHRHSSRWFKGIISRIIIGVLFGFTGWFIIFGGFIILAELGIIPKTQAPIADRVAIIAAIITCLVAVVYLVQEDKKSARNKRLGPDSDEH